MRSFESVHGSVTFTIGALLFLAGLLTIWERAKVSMISRIVAIAMSLGAIGIAAIYRTDEKTIPPTIWIPNNAAEMLPTDLRRKLGVGSRERKFRSPAATAPARPGPQPSP